LRSSGEDDLNENKATKNWFARRVEGEAKKDRLPFSERAGNVVATLAILLILLFFVVHQTSSTEFFTSKFGSAETFLFYVSILLTAVGAAAKVVVGRKNVLRPFDTFQEGLSAVALVWLFLVFPFDFSHLADVLPNFLRFLLLWISNDVAKVLLAIAIIATPVLTVYTAVLYVFVRRELLRS